MDPNAALAAIRRAAVEAALEGWPELGGLVDQALATPLDGFALVPVITGVAMGGSGAADRAVAAAAAITLQALSFTVLDDLADQDVPDSLPRRWGIGRSAQIAAALGLVALRSARALGSDALVDGWLDAAIVVFRGQDREQAGSIDTLAEYHRTVADKTVAAFRFAAWAGATVAGADGRGAEAAGRCGEHVGWMLQLLDDLEAFWFAEGPAELVRGLRTYPVWLGLGTGDARVRAAVQRGDVEALRTLLSDNGVRARILELAADHRDRAREALAPFDPAGTAALRRWTDELFRDWRRLAGPVSVR